MNEEYKCEYCSIILRNKHNKIIHTLTCALNPTNKKCGSCIHCSVQIDWGCEAQQSGKKNANSPACHLYMPKKG